MSPYLDKKHGRWRYRARVTLPSGSRCRISGSSPKSNNTITGAIAAQVDHVLRLQRKTGADLSPERVTLLEALAREVDAHVCDACDASDDCELRQLLGRLRYTR